MFTVDLSTFQVGLTIGLFVGGSVGVVLMGIIAGGKGV